jgi:hypothetical protein
MPPRRRSALIVCLLLLAPAVACGKKGPPLAPRVRVPAPVNTITARRVGDDVFITFQVPSQNVDGSMPADIASVEVFALTTDAPPSYAVFLQRATRIATLSVSPPVSPSEPARQPLPDAVAPGAAVTVHDQLVGDALQPVTIPPEKGRGGIPPPSTAPSATGAGATASANRPASPRRYYIAVASSAKQRSSPTGAQASVSIATPAAPPSGLAIVYDQRMLTLSWNGAGQGDKFNVYRHVPVPPEGTAAATPVRIPVPLNGTPLDVTNFRAPVEFGREICFLVRTVRVEESGEPLEGPASERPECERPIDMFPPAPPADVRATSGTGEITLQWLPNAEPDLAGYLVLRGAPGDATLAPITQMPITPNRYVDRSVMPGVRYVYAVVAVDNAPDANRSQPSARDEATAR